MQGSGKDAWRTEMRQKTGHLCSYLAPVKGTQITGPDANIHFF